MNRTGPIIATALLAALASAVGAAPVIDEWPRYGHDASLTGRSSLTGRISTPRTLWTYPMGGREWLLEILPLPGAHQLRLGATSAVAVASSRNGKTLWSLAAPVPTCPKMSAANIDGRKGDELIYTAGSKLIVITGDRSAGRILWEWTGPSRLSLPAIGDVDGQGFAEIVVQSADGTVHCIGN